VFPAPDHIALQRFDRHLEVDFALPRQHHFLGLSVVLEHQAGIFLDQLGECRGNLDFVLAVARGDGQAIDRRQSSRGRCRASALFDDSRSPVTTLSSRASTTVSPALASLFLTCLSPDSAKMPPTRASPAGPCRHRIVFHGAAQDPDQAQFAMTAMESFQHFHDWLGVAFHAATYSRRGHFRHFMA